MKILFTGGGTGGHIFPIAAIAREIKRVRPDIELVYAGPRDEWANLFLPQEGIKVTGIWSGKLRRYLSPSAILLNILDLFKLFLGMFQAFFLVFIENPDLIFSKGGYGSIPVTISGKILQIPIFLHESDVIPGLSNRLMGKTALEIFVSFPKTEYFNPQKMILTGNPIRKELLEGSREKAKELLQLTEEKPVLFIYPGSQGAQSVNDLVLLILPDLLKEFEVVHHCGTRNFHQVVAEAKIVIPGGLGKYYHPLPLVREQELKEIYFAADIVVSRAGAANIFEIAACGKPSILIPLAEAAQGHQAKNAYAFAENGAAIVIEEANLTPHFFLEKLKSLIANPDLLKVMGEKAKLFARPESAEVIANYLLEYLTAG